VKKGLIKHVGACALLRYGLSLVPRRALLLIAAKETKTAKVKITGEQ